MAEHRPLSTEHHTLRGPERGGPLTPETERAIIAALGISEERVERLRAIARLVGEDWGMRVDLGKPGGGSFFSEDEGRIQLDPLHLSEFVVAHEGGHRAISRGPKAIGLKAERAAELYGKLGFAFGANACEDPANNDWWSQKYEGLRETVDATYDPMFDRDAAVLGTPEIHRMVAERGSAPKFVHFGSEIIRLWHTGAYSEIGLPDDVRQALERVREPAEAYFRDVPSAHPNESEVIERARSRFRTFHDRIWPEMEKLVAEDLKDERLRQMVEDAVEQSSSSSVEREQERRGGVPSPPEGGGGGVPSPFDELPDDLRKELEDAMREAAERAVADAEAAGESEAQEREEDARKLREAAARLRTPSEHPTPTGSLRADAPPPPTPPRSGGEPSRGEGESGEAGESGAADDLEARAADLERQAKDLRAKAAQRAQDFRDGKAPQSVPLDALSEKLRRALEAAYAKLPADVRAKLEAAARRALEDLEDKLNRALQGALVPDKPESHAERHEREEREVGERDRQQRVAAEEARAREEITRVLEQSKTPYDRAYAEVAPLIDRLVDDLERLFQKQRHPRWKPGFPWSRLDLRKAMQFEADPSRYWDLGEHTTIPEKHDRVFTILVDLSGSMDGAKIRETFKATILIGEALARVGIEVEILGFHTQILEFRTADEPMSDVVRSRMGRMPAEASQQNPRADGTDTGYAVSVAANRLVSRPARERFLVVLTDGRPEPIAAHQGPTWELANVLTRIAKQGDVRVVGIGIDMGEQTVRKYFKNSAVPPSIAALPESLAALFEDMMVNPETY